jgi:hypothetical protein
VWFAAAPERGEIATIGAPDIDVGHVPPLLMFLASASDRSSQEAGMRQIRFDGREGQGKVMAVAVR